MNIYIDIRISRIVISVNEVDICINVSCYDYPIECIMPIISNTTIVLYTCVSI